MFGHFLFRGANPSLGSSPESFTRNRFSIQSSSAPYEDEETVVFVEDYIAKTFDGRAVGPKNQSETVAQMYRDYGEDFISKCDGQFLIVLYDKKDESLVVYNNRYHTHKLYYWSDENGIAFSSSLRRLTENFIPSPEPHIGSVKSFVSNGFTIPDQTQIKGVKKLLPTFRIRARESGFELKNHWPQEFDFNRREFDKLEEKLDEYEYLYSAGLKRQLELYQTKELGCLLSGGHDTSFAFAHASKIHPRPAHAFTVVFPGWAWDEGENARNVCEKFGGKFHPVPFTSGDLDKIVDVIRIVEEPVVSVSLPLHKLALHAKDVVDTIIGGDGGDTLWGEYYPVAEFHRFIKYLPLGLRKAVHNFTKLLRDTTDWERFWELEHVASLFACEDYYQDFMRRLCTYRHFTDDYQRQLFKPEFYTKQETQKSVLEVEFTRQNFREALIEAKLFNAFYTYMSFFTYKIMNNEGMNLIFPTINKDLMDFITRLPYNWVNGGTSLHRLSNNKSINRRFHKKALSRHLDQNEIYNRSFDIPWHKILKPRKEVLELLKERLKKRGWYNENELDKLFAEFRSQKAKEHELLELKHHGYRIYTLLALEIWCMEFIDSSTPQKNGSVTLEEYLSF